MSIVQKQCQVLVTGVAQGIGAAVATAFAKLDRCGLAG